MAQDWDIRPRGETCHKCQGPFVEEQVYFSALLFSEDGYNRADFCQNCWQTVQPGFSPYSTWQGLFRPPPPQEDVLKKETAESLLRHLMEDKDTSQRNAIYILALMLERKRILVERDVQTRENGDIIRIYEHRKTGETFVVPDPQLHLDQLEHVQQEVVAMLGSGQETPSAPGTPPEAAAAASPAAAQAPEPEKPAQPATPNKG